MDVDKHFEMIYKNIASFKDNLLHFKSDYLKALDIVVPPAINFSLEIIPANPLDMPKRIPRYYRLFYSFYFSRNQPSLLMPDEVTDVRTSTIYIYDSFDIYRYFRDLQFHFWEHVSNNLGNKILAEMLTNLGGDFKQIEENYEYYEIPSSTVFEKLTELVVAELEKLYPTDLLKAAKIIDVKIKPSSFDFKQYNKEDSVIFQFDVNYSVETNYVDRTVNDEIGIIINANKDELQTKKALLAKMFNIVFWLIVKDCYWGCAVMPQIFKDNYSSAITRDVLLG